MSLEITSGITKDGVIWHWRDGYLPPTTLFIYPQLQHPNEDDKWRRDESLETMEIMESLAIPKLSVVTIDPRPLTPHNQWTSDDTAPRWIINSYTEHLFKFGIVRKLLSGLAFDGLPTHNLLEAWDSFGEVIEDDEHDEIWIRANEEE